MVSCEPSTYTGDPDIAARACRLHVLKEYRAKQIGFGLLDACYSYCKDKYKILYITHDINSKAMQIIKMPIKPKKGIASLRKIKDKIVTKTGAQPLATG